ncbi:MAG TPA: copper chaperone PCu(A)C [Actinocrinis sp.]
MIAALAVTAVTTALLCAACSASTPAPSLTVTGAVVVEPVTSGDPATAYFTIDIHTSSTDSLISVTSPVSTHIVLNNTGSAGSTAAPIAAPAQTSTALTPFGPDVCVFDPATLHPGAFVQLDLQFKNAGTIAVQAAMRTAARSAGGRSPSS